jgi:arylsulfatase A-like enzyme
MYRPLSLLSLLLCLSLITSSCTDEPSESAKDTPPNIIYILADDLGYGELGVYGQELIETPHLDALAKGGMRFTQHYSGAPVCAPARGVLLMGQHTGHAHVRGNDEDGSRGDVWNYQAMLDDPSLEGQRPIPDSLITLGEVLQAGGYRTALVGKWGLGAPGSEGVPNQQGFDYFYGYNCQRQAHNLFPTHLWENDQRVFLNNEFMAPHQERLQGEDQSDDEFFNQYILNDYAPEFMHRAALEFIEAERDTSFFLYYASPLPHVPLQAPQRWIEHYREKLGPEEAYRGKSYFPCQYPRATYAAMISYLDEQVGDLVAKLKELGIYDNTLIIFSSDNGPTYAGGADTEFFDSAKPFRTNYGFGKGFVHEGGIRVPMVAHWPARVKPETTSEHISAFQDVLPTLAEVAGLTPPANDGISFLPSLLGEEQQAHEYLYWEFPAYQGQQAVRKGNWKAIRKNLHQGKIETELYNLESDPEETTNLANDHPEVVAEMEAIMAKEHVPSPFLRFQYAVFGEK